jgi:hypothetical protein
LHQEREWAGEILQKARANAKVSALHSENLASQTYKYANSATMLNIAWTGKKLAR